MELSTRSDQVRVVVVEPESTWAAEFGRLLANTEVQTIGALEGAADLAAGCDVFIVAVELDSDGSQEAALLEHLRQYSPASVRFVLLESDGSAFHGGLATNSHCILRKPISVDELARHVSGALAVSARLSHLSLLEVVAGIGNLPSLPTLYMELERELQNRASSLKSVAVIISRDPGIAARVMQLANSTYFNRGGEITDINEAVTLLGVGVIKALVLAVKLFGGARGQVDPRLFEHSFHVGLLAMALARSEGAPRRVVEVCFLAGLLHDVGQLVLAAGLPARYRKILERAATGTSLRARELEELGTDHTEIGAHLLRLWGLPEAVTVAVLEHHAPTTAWPESGSLSVPLLLHAANALELEAAATGGLADDDALDESLLASAGLAGNLEEWRGIAAAICKIPFSI